MVSSWEEFYERYEQPSIGDVIVGFSGIDPQKKSTNWTDGTAPIPETIKDGINETVLESLVNQTIVFDGGEIN